VYVCDPKRKIMEVVCAFSSRAGKVSMKTGTLFR
jgi:hypothetical protein